LLGSDRYLAAEMQFATVATRCVTPVTKNVHPPLPADPPNSSQILRNYFDAMFAHLGPRHWWPAKTRFEVIVGAILTQNTAWSNVKRALDNLRRERLLVPAAIESVATTRLARLIRPSGYFRQKARKLKAFAGFLRREYRGSLLRMFRTPTPELREKLLNVHGVGPETADSILLYAGNHPVFVVDAYTRRILERHALIHARAGYDEIQDFFQRSLPRDASLFNEYHALIVNVGKEWCRTKNPRCNECPLRPFLPEGNGVTIP